MVQNDIYTLGIDIGSTTVKIAVLDQDNEVLFSDYERHFANIQETLSSLLQKAYDALGDFSVAPMITGSGGLTLAKHLGIPFVQEHFEVIVLGIVAVSVAPAFIGVIKAALNSRRAKEGDPVAQAAERVNEAEYERELTEERVMRAEAEAKAEARRRVVAEDAQAASETEEKGGE